VLVKEAEQLPPLQRGHASSPSSSKSQVRVLFGGGKGF